MSILEYVAKRLASLVILLGLLAGAAHAGAYEDLFVAIRNDEADAVKALLDRGMDPNTRDPKGFPALTLAARHDAWHAFEVLFNAKGIDLNARNAVQETPLMYVARAGRVDWAGKLIEKGAEVNHPGWTPLHYAATFGRNEMVKLLLEHSAYIDAESPNKTTPIMMAARHGHIETVKLLLDEGADARLKNQQGLTAVDFAAQAGHRDIAEGLARRLEREDAERRSDKPWAVK